MSSIQTTCAAVDGRTARLHLDVPGLSASEVAAYLIDAVSEVCNRAEDGSGSGPVILEMFDGDPHGSDRWADRELSITLVNRWERTVRRLERIAAPSVAVAHANCFGRSLDLLLATDYRIATPSVRIGLTRAAGALWPGMALHRLVHQVGAGRARRMALFGEHLTASEATEIGLLDEVTDDLAGAVRAVTRQVGELSSAELAVRRRLLLEATTTGHDEAIGVHLAACDRTLRRVRDEADRMAS